LTYLYIFHVFLAQLGFTDTKNEGHFIFLGVVDFIGNVHEILEIATGGPIIMENFVKYLFLLS
jgi:hypothetical protein